MFGSESFPVGPNGQFPRQRVRTAGNELVPPQNMEEVYWRSGVARLPVVEKEYHGSVNRVKSDMSVGRPNIHARIHKGFRPRYAKEIFIGMPVFGMRQNVLNGEGLGASTGAEKEAKRQALVRWQFEQKKARQEQNRLIAEQQEARRQTKLRFDLEQELARQKAKADREFAVRQQMPDVKYRRLLAKQEQVRVLQEERHGFKLEQERGPLDLKLAKAQLTQELDLARVDKNSMKNKYDYEVAMVKAGGMITPIPGVSQEFYPLGMAPIGAQPQYIQYQEPLTSPYTSPYEDTRPYVPGMPIETMDEMYQPEFRSPVNRGPEMAEEYYEALGPEAELTPEADYQPENAWALW